uniref:ENTH domain-containing protein n=1 Tax=Globodera rostochiensis TaxID=31243 RepID=A0A914H3H3_GLORO
MSSITTLRRQVKNVACNFTDAQVKVREATSNDPWGPTTVLMSEIADLTHNPVSFTEIMSMVWKRLNDHGKNWRHVYKSMVLLDYLIKCGSEKVSAQCRENLFSIETLKDFQHIEDNRDQGLNDEEKLKNERARFMLTRKRFIQNGSSGIASDGSRRTVGRRHIETGPSDPEFEEARPSSLGEEEMQLQIALALSKEECEKEQELRRGDDIRLQIAIEESKRVVERSSSLSSPTRGVDSTERQGTSKSHGALDDLLSLGDIFKSSVPTAAAAGSSSQTHQQQPQITPFNDPWSPRPSTTIPTVGTAPPFSSVRQTSPLQNDPWAPAASSSDRSVLSSESVSTNRTLYPDIGQGHVLGSLTQSSPANNDPWASFEAQNFSTTRPKQHFSDDLFGNIVEPTRMANSSTNAGQQRANTKTPESFLGENSVLVNLDNLLGPSNNTQIVPKNVEATNPFLVGKKWWRFVLIIVGSAMWG